MNSFGLPALGEYPMKVDAFHSPSQLTVTPVGMVRLAAALNTRVPPEDAANEAATRA